MHSFQARFPFSLFAALLGLLLSLLITNDFNVLLIEELFNISGIKLPIAYSSAGFNAKYFVMDRPPLWAIIQFTSLGLGTYLLLETLSYFIPKQILLAIAVGPLSLGLIFVLFSGLSPMFREVPGPFAAALILAPLPILAQVFHTGSREFIRRRLLLFCLPVMLWWLHVGLLKSHITLVWLLPISLLYFALLFEESLNQKFFNLNPN